MYRLKKTSKCSFSDLFYRRLSALCLRFLITSVFLSILSACNTSEIYNDQNFNPPVYFGAHTVRKGETLYAIAWRYGRDYKELGSANKIKPPYTIKLGQRIRLDLRGTVSSNSHASPSPKNKTPKKKESPTKNKVSSTKNNKTSTSRKTKSVKGVKWRWPHSGSVIANYSSTGKVNKGIDIAGRLGDSVFSAASGEVVYAGSGLLGYGKLIIINHNEHYLSAYAHNEQILVKEGQKINSGQKIAEMGSTGASRVKLHFEIRRDGKPVNPLSYLPKRR